MRNLNFVISDFARRAGERVVSIATRNGFQDEARRKLVFAEFGLRLDPGQHVFLLDQLWLAKTLRDAAGASFSLNNAGELTVKTLQFETIIETEEELFILHEILVGRVYDFENTQPVVVWDIGLNVGLSALYFASRSDVVAVIGYEPFARTFQQARRNFQLNENLAEKIGAHNTGVAAEERTATVEYCYEWKGMVGLNGVPEHRRNGQPISLEEITLDDVNKALDQIVAEYPGIDIVAKIDCEGAEYELIDALCSTNRINSIKLIMMEWHQRGPKPLSESLTRAGFSTFSLPNSSSTGMIYAVRT